jgi:Holliday junction resolvase
MRERVIERRLVAECHKAGIVCMKFVSPGHAGVPDRIVLHEGRTTFIEVKAPGMKPTKLQENCHKNLREAGFEVVVLDNPDDIEALVERLA